MCEQRSLHIAPGQMETSGKKEGSGLESPECTHLEGLGTLPRVMLKTAEINCYQFPE